jgi:hypothetical protein
MGLPKLMTNSIQNVASAVSISPDTAEINYDPKLPPSCKEDFLEAVHAAYFVGRTSTTCKEEAQATVINEAVARINAKRSSLKEESSTDIVYTTASLLFLRDLLQMGWTLSLKGPTSVYLSRTPMPDDVDEAKRQVRRSMSFERIDSLRVPSVKTFVTEMERSRLIDGHERNIFSLIASGKYLGDIIGEACKVPDHERTSYLSSRVRPYMQLVEGDLRDTFTGMRLIDIWRYFRLTWSTPHRPTPGRNLFYLIRDAAHPCHAIIGISALSNVVIGLHCRDERIGWTPEALARWLIDAKRRDIEEPGTYPKAVKEISELLERHLDDGISLIDHEGITTRNEITYPSEEGIAAIESFAEQASQERFDYLKQESLTSFDDQLLELEYPDSNPQGFVAREERESSAALFRRKRASKLAVLLRAKLLFQQKNLFENPLDGLPRLLWTDKEWTRKSEAGRSAIRNTLLANKDTKIGSSMMDITVCGAIAPYNHLLGGKLVAMLHASPQVIEDYRSRYGTRVSTIASQVAGRDVTREAKLVLLTTSSLYAAKADVERSVRQDDKISRAIRKFVGASQYNRISVPTNRLGGHGIIRYEGLGVTLGYGVVHFAADTRQAFEELDLLIAGARRVNSMFGEGTSPRLRKIRQGLSTLGLDEELLVHGQARLVYGINLAHNTERYLLGLDREPDYIMDLTDPYNGTVKVAEYWIERWLKSRLKHKDSVDRVLQFDPKSLAISQEYGADIDTQIPFDL